MSRNLSRRDYKGRFSNVPYVFRKFRKAWSLAKQTIEDTKSMVYRNGITSIVVWLAVASTCCCGRIALSHEPINDHNQELSVAAEMGHSWRENGERAELAGVTGQSSAERPDDASLVPSVASTAPDGIEGAGSAAGAGNAGNSNIARENGQEESVVPSEVKGDTQELGGPVAAPLSLIHI